MSARSKSNRSLKAWYSVHKWSSLICTLFILVACITGLPLIFHAEIESAIEPTSAYSTAESLNFDALIAKAEEASPGKAVQFVLREPNSPGVTAIGLGETVSAPIGASEIILLENATGDIQGSQVIYEGVLGFFAELHIELFAGQFGTLFLGLMTLFFIAAMISGMVVYAPFMKHRSFQFSPAEKTTKRRWFDLHNSLGMVLGVWLLVVSITGAINTIGAPLIQLWLMTDMQEEVSAEMDTPLPDKWQRTSFEAAYQQARAELPDSQFYFAMFPGTELSSDRHYLVFSTGTAPVNSRLFQPTIVNAYTGAFVSAPEFPTYMKVFLLSQPLHFGDYGGWPLKVAWAVLEIGAIIYIKKELVLWWRRRRFAPIFERAPTSSEDH